MKTTEQKVPALRFPEFEGEWEVKKLGEVSEFSKGKGISKADIVDDGKIECIRYGELYTSYGEIISRIISKTNINREELIFSQLNDVIIPASGETAIDIATASCVLKDDVALGGDLNIIRGSFDGCFLAYNLNNKQKTKIASLAQGSSVMHLYPIHLEILKISFPSLPEQQKIADFLSATDKRLELLKEKKQGLEDYKRGAMQRIFSQELRFTRPDGSAYPDWEEKKLGEVLFIKTPIVAEVIDPTKILTVRLHQKGVHPSNISQYYNVGATKYYVREKGDFIFGKQNIFNGAFAIIPDEFDSFITSGDIPSLGVKPLLNSKYLICFLSNDYFYKTLESLSIGTGSKRLHEKEFLRVKINLPSLPEQTQIANFLSAINVKIEKLSEQIEVTENYKKGLLQQMFV